MKTTMNWSSSPIRTTLLLLILLMIGNKGQAQSKANFSYGAGVSGGLGFAIINSSDYSKYTDTMKSSSGVHFNKGVHAWVSYSLGKHSDIQIGLGYQQTGFQRSQRNLVFKNYTYPGIGTGRIEDNSNSEKGIDYNYRFHYISVPVYFNNYLGRTSDFKWFFHFSGGVTTQVLVKHHLVANTITGYSINNENHFVLDSSGFTPRSLAFSAHVGAFIENRVDKNKAYFFQPQIGIYPFSVVSGSGKVNPFFVSLTVGVLFSKGE